MDLGVAMVDEEDFLQMDVEELRPQFIEAFEGASYPVTSDLDLAPGLPQGPATSFESNGIEFTVMEMDNIDSGDTDVDVDAEPDYPYDDVESLVDDICEGMKEAQEALRKQRQEQ